MKNTVLAVGLATIFLSSCEVEYRGDARYHHYWGYEHAHYPNHQEVYNHGYHHDVQGGEIKIQKR